MLTPPFESDIEIVLIINLIGTSSSLRRQKAEEEVVERQRYDPLLQRQQLSTSFQYINNIKLTHDSLLYSQGQGQPRRRPRQSDLRQALQRRAILPAHHRCHPRRSAEDQWQFGETGVERSGGERADQEGGGAQQVEHLQ